MIRRIACTLALTACTLAPLASNASIFHHSDNAPVAASTLPKGKTVKLTLKNRTASAMTLTINDQPVTIAANGEYELRTTEGTDIYDADHNVKLHVTRELSGNAVSFR